MRIHRRRLSRRDAERLLADPAAHGSALGTVLAAASGPGQPTELGREDAAAAAFHRTGMIPSPGGGTVFLPAPRRNARTGVRAAVATGAIVALTSGGFALAGSADLPHIPGLPDQASDRATESSSAATVPESSDASSTSASPGKKPSATGGPRATGSGSGSPSPSTSTATSAPTPNLQGLCHAFQATDHSANGSSLTSAAFAALAAAAGGDAQVADYCVTLIGEPKPTGKPTAKPTDKPTAKPTDKPTGKPTDKPTSKPTQAATPTGKPTDKPTGKPTETSQPTGSPTSQPSGKPTDQPTGKPSTAPGKPTTEPSPTDEGGG